MNESKVIVFTFADCMGGVSSFNRNIINFSQRHPGFSIRVILMNDEQDSREKFTDTIIADEVITFHYSYWNNQRVAVKRLSDLIGTEPGCVVTDNAYTLNVLRQMGTPKSIVHLVHDYYYVNVAREYKSIIDACVVHSSFFRDILFAADIDFFEDKTQYISYGVEQAGPDFKVHRPADDDKLNLVFLGRWTRSKGVLLLKHIDRLLQAKSIEVNWTVVGSGPLENELKEQWRGDQQVRFVTAADTREVYEILASQDVLIFPSKFEGTPVAIMEAISRGVVPVVTDLPGGTREMMTTDIGFRCRPRKAEDFADAIGQLHNDRTLLSAMKEASLKRSKGSYDIKDAAGNYFAFFEKMCAGHADHKKLVKTKFSWLDNSVIPDRLVYLIRKSKARNR